MESGFKGFLTGSAKDAWALFGSYCNFGALRGFVVRT